MKNRIKGLLVLIGLSLLVLSPVDVSAAQNTSLLPASGKNVASPGDEISYVITLSSTDTIISYRASLEYDSSILRLVSISNGSGWSGQNSISSRDLSFTTNGVSGQSNVATLKFKVATNTSKKSTIIRLNGVNVCAKESNTPTTPETTPTTPTDPATAACSNITTSPKTLNIQSSDNQLSALKVNGKSVSNFSKNNYEYAMSVESSVEKAVIKATTNDSSASFVDGFGNRTVDLEYGENKIEVRVKSERGDQQVYTIRINREDDRTTENHLEEIVIGDKKIEKFDKDTLSYYVKVYKQDKITITALTVDEKATYKVDGPTTLKIGENEFKITVTSEAGEDLIYTVTVDNIDSEISKKLKSLSISGYDIEFDKNNQRYEILYNKDLIKKLKIYFTTEAKSDEVTVTVTPDLDDKEALAKLKAGDEIVITIEGIDGEKEEYVIVLKKDKRINFFFVVELIILIGLIAAITVVVIKRKKDKNNPTKKEKTKKENDNDDDDSVVIAKHGKTASSRVERYDEEKPKKKKRFSIYEDEYEEVEIEVDDEDEEEIGQTKEYK